MVGPAPDGGAADIGGVHAGELGFDGGGLDFFAQAAVAASGEGGMAEFGDQDRLVRVALMELFEALAPEAGGLCEVVGAAFRSIALEQARIAVDAEDVVIVEMGLVLPAAADMDGQASGVELLCQADECGVAGGDFGPLFLGLVAGGPEDEGGVVEVAVDHALQLAFGGVERGGAIFLALLQAVPPVEGDLVHGEQAEFVAQVEFTGMVRVVAEADKVGAGVFHGEQIFANGCQVGGHGAFGGVLVAVETGEVDRLVVEEELIVACFDAAEAEADGLHVDGVLLGDEFDAGGVERGIGRRPEVDSAELALAGEFVFPVGADGGEGSGGTGDWFAPGVADLDDDVGELSFRAIVADADADGELAGLVRGGE